MNYDQLILEQLKQITEELKQIKSTLGNSGGYTTTGSSILSKLATLNTNINQIITNITKGNK